MSHQYFCRVDIIAPIAKVADVCPSLTLHPFQVSGTLFSREAGDRRMSLGVSLGNATLRMVKLLYDYKTYWRLLSITCTIKIERFITT